MASGEPGDDFLSRLGAELANDSDNNSDLDDGQCEYETDVSSLDVRSDEEDEEDEHEEDEHEHIESDEEPHIHETPTKRLPRKAFVRRLSTSAEKPFSSMTRREKKRRMGAYEPPVKCCNRQCYMHFDREVVQSFRKRVWVDETEDVVRRRIMNYLHKEVLLVEQRPCCMRFLTKDRKSTRLNSSHSSVSRMPSSA